MSRGRRQADEEWSERELDLLCRYWAEGVSIRQIGRAVGRTHNAVAGKARRMKLAPRPSPLTGGYVAKMAPAANAPPPLPSSRGCQWIAGEPRGVKTVFCGSPAKPFSSYCPEHHAKCWVKPPKRERGERMGEFVIFPSQRKGGKRRRVA